MKTFQGLTLKSMLVLVAVSVFSIATVNAQPPVKDAVDCEPIGEPALKALCLATNAAASQKDRDRNGLAGKVFRADTKLTDKCTGAVQKLEDYEGTVEKLDTAPRQKISDADADCLLDGDITPPADACGTIGVRAIIMDLDPTCP